jgi:hypothetical protein
METEKMADNRVAAVHAYVKALRTGEHSAAAQVSPLLAPDAVLVGGKQDSEGHDEVLNKVTGQWPNTPTYLVAAWSEVAADGDRLKTTGSISGLGAAPAAINLTFSFNAAGQISRVEQEIVPQTPPAPSDKMPDVVKSMVNGALANGTPMTVAYVDTEGRPSLSLRGSVQAFSDNQLCIWLRTAEKGMAKALEANSNVSLLYRDQKSRSTLIFQGRGHIENDEEIRRRVWEMAPEVEQNHDPKRETGVALIIDLDRVQGFTPRGGVRMTRSPS